MLAVWHDSQSVCLSNMLTSQRLKIYFVTNEVPDVRNTFPCSDGQELYYPRVSHTFWVSSDCLGVDQFFGLMILQTSNISSTEIKVGMRA